MERIHFNAEIKWQKKFNQTKQIKGNKKNSIVLNVSVPISKNSYGSC